jgi:hypothetical protein
MAYIESLLVSWQGTLSAIGPMISIILIILGGILYGVSHTQPSEMRGKWQAAAIGMIIGGVIVAAVVGAATLIRDSSMKLLT